MMPQTVQIVPDLPFLTHRQNLRDTYTLTQVITFNCLTGLFHGHCVSSFPHPGVFIRFCKLRKGFLEVLRPRFDSVAKNMADWSHLVPYTAFATTDYHFYLVMQNSADMYFLVDAIKDGIWVVSEGSLKRGVFGAIETLVKMHSVRIPHGQLSPYKILLKGEEWWWYDVAVGVETREDLIAENYYFLAPEVLNGETPGLHSDVWALGATLYYLVTGRTVYGGRDYSEYIGNVAVHEPSFADSVWDRASELKGLIKNMLIRDKTCRPTMAAVLSDPWFQSASPPTEIPLTESLQESIEKTRGFTQAIQKLMNTLANTKSRTTIRNWKDCLAGEYSRTLGFGCLLEKVLGDSHPLCEEFYEYWQEPIDYREFLLSVIGLNTLITQERGAILFYQLTTNGRRYLEEKDIAKVLENTGHSEIVHGGGLVRLIKQHQQNPIRADRVLWFPEFLQLCDTLELTPSEEFIMGRFFDDSTPD